MIYFHKNGQAAWFFARLVRKDPVSPEPNTLYVWDGHNLRSAGLHYWPGWADGTKQATPSQLHNLIVYIWNATSIKTS